MNEIIRIKEISKHFGGTIALNKVSFSISKGEVHAIVGENGAGKSTLMKILAGIYSQYKGKIFINGKEAKIKNPISAKDSGISIVFQEMKLFPQLNVLENIFLGREETYILGFLKKNKMKTESMKWMETLFHDIDPLKNIEELSIGERQIVEIARALAENSKILILDEPNSTLNEKESQNLFDIILKLKEQGITIIYVSHRLDEIFKLADRVTVLRDGKYIGTSIISKTTIQEIIKQMIGKEINELFSENINVEKLKFPILKITDLSKKGYIEDINFEVYKGEKIGFAGLDGCGIDTIFKILFGLEKPDRGEIIFKNKKVPKLTPWHAMKLGWALIPSDRRKQGLMTNWSIKENISLPVIDNMVSRINLVSDKKIENLSKQYIKELNIVTDSANKNLNLLSGGNQQKTVMAKWLATKPKLLILNDPTRGIDVGSKAEIYSLINNLSLQGLGILFTSSELDEIIGICHKTYVLYKGRITKVIKNSNLDRSDLRMYIGGNI